MPAVWGCVAGVAVEVVVEAQRLETLQRLGAQLDELRVRHQRLQ
jgi:hypothetical protein